MTADPGWIDDQEGSKGVAGLTEDDGGQADEGVASS